MTLRAFRNFVLAALLLGCVGIGALVAFVEPPVAGLAPTPPDARFTHANPAEPGSLLAQVLEAHGGVARWSAVEKVRVKLRFGGAAFQLRFANPDARERWIELDLASPRSVFHDYPEPGQRGVFTADRVWIEAEDGRELRSLDRPRETLLASRRRQLWWDDLDLLYFAGQASWNYFQGPFLLQRDGVEVRETEPWEENGETWRRLLVRFPLALPTHAREQDFYFGPDFRLRRQDYTPEVYASWASAAHYAFDDRDFDGIWFPTRRRVLPRGADNRSRDWPTLVWIEVTDALLLRAGRSGGSTPLPVSRP